METPRDKEEEFEEEEWSEFRKWFETASNEEILEEVASMLLDRRLHNILCIALEIVKDTEENLES